VLDLTFCQRNGDSHRRLGSFRAGDDPHYDNGLLPFLPFRLGDEMRKNLDFKDLILPINDVKERSSTALTAPCSMPRAVARA